jgi:hypothetical protein
MHMYKQERKKERRVEAKMQTQEQSAGVIRIGWE